MPRLQRHCYNERVKCSPLVLTHAVRWWRHCWTHCTSCFDRANSLWYKCSFLF